MLSMHPEGRRTSAIQHCTSTAPINGSYCSPVYFIRSMAANGDNAPSCIGAEIACPQGGREVSHDISRVSLGSKKC